MKDMNAKKDLRFAFAWIISYVVIMSVFENLFNDKISQGWRMLPAGIFLLALYLEMGRKSSFSRYGFVSMNAIPWKMTLFLMPMAIIATANLWSGVVQRFKMSETIFYIISMIAIGFIEEILFRGFLLHALLNRSVKTAIIISSLTFGLGHIVNLVNGSDFTATFLQIIYACSIGLMLSVFVIRIGNIIPCCIFHGVFNALSAFANEAEQTIIVQIICCFVISMSAIGYAIWLWNLQRRNTAVH